MTTSYTLEACSTCGFAGTNGCPRRNTRCPRYVHPLNPEFERVKLLNKQLGENNVPAFVSLEVGAGNTAKRLAVYHSREELTYTDHSTGNRRIGTLRPEATFEEVWALSQGYETGRTLGSLDQERRMRQQMAAMFGFVTREEFEEGRNHE